MDEDLRALFNKIASKKKTQRKELEDKILSLEITKQKVRDAIMSFAASKHYIKLKNFMISKNKKREAFDLMINDIRKSQEIKELSETFKDSYTNMTLINSLIRDHLEECFTDLFLSALMSVIIENDKKNESTKVEDIYGTTLQMHIDAAEALFRQIVDKIYNFNETLH